MASAHRAINEMAEYARELELENGRLREAWTICEPVIAGPTPVRCGHCNGTGIVEEKADA